MKLHTVILEYELKRNFIIKRNSCTSDAQRYESPYLYSSSASQKHRIYILPKDVPLPSAIPEDSMLICCREQDYSSVSSAKYPIIYTSAFETPELFNAVQTIYDKYNNWIKGMNDLLTEWRNPLQRILNLCAEVHENMFIVQDTGFKTIAVAWSGTFNAGREWDADKIKTSLGMKLPRSVMNIIKEQFPERRDSRKAMHHDLTFTETIDVPLFSGSIYLGMLSMLQYNRDFDPHDYPVMELLGSYISHVLSVESALKPDNTGELSSVFTQLLSGKTIEKETIDSIIGTVGFRMDDSFIVAALSFPTEKETAYINYIQQEITSEIEGSVCCKKKPYLAVMINTSSGADNKETWLDTLRSLTSEFGLRTGLSDSFSGFERCPAFFNEAAAAISLTPPSEGPGVYRFSSIRTRYALKHCCGELDREMLYTDGFKRLLKHEETAGVSYIETLRVLLEENMSMSRAARRLYITRNTLLSRNERLKAVLQEDLNDPDVRFALELSLRLYLSKS